MVYSEISSEIDTEITSSSGTVGIAPSCHVVWEGYGRGTGGVWEAYGRCGTNGMIGEGAGWYAKRSSLVRERWKCAP